MGVNRIFVLLTFLGYQFWLELYIFVFGNVKSQIRYNKKAIHAIIELTRPNHSEWGGFFVPFYKRLLEYETYRKYSIYIITK
jgi:hypothetical protein